MRSVGRARRSLAPLGLAVAVAALVADQASKWWVLHVLDLPRLLDVGVLPGLDLTMVFNRGVTFGLLQAGGSGRWLLGLAALAITVLLAGWMRRTDRVVIACCLGLIVGGAVGNILDRLRCGAVTDFIRVHAAGFSWYVFNVADACIVCGVGALLIDGLLPRRAGGR